MALENGVILVDTKYEFGKTADGTVVLIDEVVFSDLRFLLCVQLLFAILPMHGAKSHEISLLCISIYMLQLFQCRHLSFGIFNV